MWETNLDLHVPPRQIVEAVEENTRVHSLLDHLLVEVLALGARDGLQIPSHGERSIRRRARPSFRLDGGPGLNKSMFCQPLPLETRTLFLGGASARDFSHSEFSRMGPKFDPTSVIEGEDPPIPCADQDDQIDSQHLCAEDGEKAAGCRHFSCGEWIGCKALGTPHTFPGC